MDPQAFFKLGSTEVHFQLKFGTGVENAKIKFKDQTILNLLNQLSERGNPEFEIIVEYSFSSAATNFVRDGVLFSIVTNPKDLITAFKTGQELLKLKNE